MPAADAANYRFNPFDLTKVWPYADYPLMEVGKMVLDRNPENYFAEVEQAAFNPAQLRAGHRPVTRQDAARAPICLWRCPPLPPRRQSHTNCRSTDRTPLKPTTMGATASCASTATAGRAKNYEPNSFGGPAQRASRCTHPLEVHGLAGAHVPELHNEDDDFVQAGNLYRVMRPDERERLIANIAGTLSRVSRPIIIERGIAHFRAAMPTSASALPRPWRRSGRSQCRQFAVRRMDVPPADTGSTSRVQARPRPVGATRTSDRCSFRA